MAVATDAEARWAEALDELEASIERFARLALTAYDTTDQPPVVPEPYLLPADLGPVPADLRDRAEELAGRADSVQTELHRVRALVGDQIAGLQKAVPAHAYHDDREPSFLDELG